MPQLYISRGYRSESEHISLSTNPNNSPRLVCNFVLSRANKESKRISPGSIADESRALCSKCQSLDIKLAALVENPPAGTPGMIRRERKLTNHRYLFWPPYGAAYRDLWHLPRNLQLSSSLHSPTTPQHFSTSMASDAPQIDPIPSEEPKQKRRRAVEACVSCRTRKSRVCSG
jgi:hypothetical protein